MQRSLEHAKSCLGKRPARITSVFSEFNKMDKPRGAIGMSEVSCTNVERQYKKATIELSEAKTGSDSSQDVTVEEANIIIARFERFRTDKRMPSLPIWVEQKKDMVQVRRVVLTTARLFFMMRFRHRHSQDHSVQCTKLNSGPEANTRSVEEKDCLLMRSGELIA